MKKHIENIKEVKPKGNICNGISVKVITFEKGSYNRNELENKSDIEKYMIALNDAEHCKIRESNEYTKELNDFKPMEKFVFTYIVIIPTEQL